MFNMDKFIKSEKGDLISVAIGIAIFLVVVGYILAPVGLTAMQNVNTTSAGMTTFTNGVNASGGLTNTSAGNIWFAIVPLALAALIVSVVYMIKNQ